MGRIRSNRREFIQATGAATVAVGLAGSAEADADLAKYDPMQPPGSVYQSIRPELIEINRIRALCNRLWQSFDQKGRVEHGRWAVLYWYNYWRMLPTTGDARIRAARLGRKMAEMVLATKTQTAWDLFWKASFVALEAMATGVLDAAHLVRNVKDLFDTVVKIDPTNYYANAQLGLAKLYFKAPPFPVSIGDLDTSKAYLDRARPYQEGKFALWYTFIAEYYIIRGQRDLGFSYLDKIKDEVDPPDIAAQYVYETTLQDAEGMRRAVLDGSYNKYTWDPVMVQLQF